MNECDLQRDMCGNGTCTNMMGTYKCDCHVGFRLSSTGRCQGRAMVKPSILVSFYSVQTVALGSQEGIS